MVGWYSRFIENESEIKLTLLKLIKKTQAWQWSTEQQAAFEKLMLALTRTHVLARPDFSLEFTVQCDASNDAIGTVLSQEFEDGEHPIVYIYRVLCREKLFNLGEGVSRTHLGDQEASTLSRGLQIQGDHCSQCVEMATNFKGTHRSLGPLGPRAATWDVRIEHRKGAMHRVPDTLSRIQENDSEETEIAAFKEVADIWYLRRKEEIRNNPVKYQSWSRGRDDIQTGTGSYVRPCDGR